MIAAQVYTLIAALLLVMPGAHAAAEPEVDWEAVPVTPGGLTISSGHDYVGERLERQVLLTIRVPNRPRAPLIRCFESQDRIEFGILGMGLNAVSAEFWFGSTGPVSVEFDSFWPEYGYTRHPFWVSRDPAAARAVVDRLAGADRLGFLIVAEGPGQRGTRDPAVITGPDFAETLTDFVRRCEDIRTAG